MKIAVVCANGKAGKLITAEAVNRGLDVTAVVRGENKTAAYKVLSKDLFDLTTEDLKDYDVVIDAFGAWTEDKRITMTQEERRIYLIKSLLAENPQHRGITIPAKAQGQWQLLRALLNVRMPAPVSPEFLEVQDAYLQEEIRQKGITDVADLTPLQEDLYLWQGDITTLRCGAIVNAANSQMLGCFCPNHGCIDKTA